MGRSNFVLSENIRVVLLCFQFESSTVDKKFFFFISLFVFAIQSTQTQIFLRSPANALKKLCCLVGFRPLPARQNSARCLHWDPVRLQ
jgi:hypothetical protein